MSEGLNLQKFFATDDLELQKILRLLEYLVLNVGDRLYLDTEFVGERLREQLGEDVTFGSVSALLVFDGVGLAGEITEEEASKAMDIVASQYSFRRSENNAEALTHMRELLLAIQEKNDESSAD